MRRLVVPAMVSVVSAVTLVLVGCSSTSTSGSLVPDDGVGVKIAEYVGDGHGGTKPWPFPLALPPGQSEAVQAQASPTVLSYGASYLYTNVYPKATNWFYLPALASAAAVVVTMQPTCNRDADLYLLQGSGMYGFLGRSDRQPSSGLDKVSGLGYAPDWVAYSFGTGTNGYPAAYVACLGTTNAEAGARYFRLEADVLQDLTVNGATLDGTLGAGQSAWCRFAGTNGVEYRVGLAALSGDPDVYIYSLSSDYFVTKHTASGGGYAGFTAPVTSLYYVRVYGYTACHYRVRLLSP